MFLSAFRACMDRVAWLPGSCRPRPFRVSPPSGSRIEGCCPAWQARKAPLLSAAVLSSATQGETREGDQVLRRQEGKDTPAAWVSRHHHPCAGTLTTRLGPLENTRSSDSDMSLQPHVL